MIEYYYKMIAKCAPLLPYIDIIWYGMIWITLCVMGLAKSCVYIG